MSLVAKMVQAAEDSVAVPFKKFMRIKQDNPDTIIAFFEGEDEKYYGSRIQNHTVSKWTGINCGGKSKVLKVREAIRGNSVYQSSHCIFFVDADFDDNQHLNVLNDVYITPCYSIENLYMSDEVFERILRSEFNITPYDVLDICHINIFEYYSNLRKEFYLKTYKFHICVRALKRTKLHNHKLNLKNIDLNKIVKLQIRNNIVQSNFTLNQLDQFFHCLKNINKYCQRHDVVEAIKIFKDDLDQGHWFRGKYSLEFLRVFLDCLRNDSNSTNPSIFKEKKLLTKMSFSKDNFISTLSQYADTPECLKIFLTRELN